MELADFFSKVEMMVFGLSLEEELPDANWANFDEEQMELISWYGVKKLWKLLPQVSSFVTL